MIQAVRNKMIKAGFFPIPALHTVIWWPRSPRRGLCQVLSEDLGKATAALFDEGSGHYNLTVSMLWHHLNVLEPTRDISQTGAQKNYILLDWAELHLGRNTSSASAGKKIKPN